MQAKDYYESEIQIRFAESVAKGSVTSMREFLEQGANVDAVGRQKMRPLFWALAKQSLKGFKFLLENGANPNIEAKGLSGDKHPLSLIELAAVMEDSRYLALLMEHGADPNLRLGSVGRTVIFSSIMHGRTENVRVLSSAGANLNHQDNAGSTPMLTAAGIKNFDIVYLLLEHGANPNVKNKWDYDLAALMRRFGDRGMKENGEQYHWYQKVIDELKRRELWN